MAFQIGDKYYIEDIESGEICEISKVTFDAMNEFRGRISAIVDPDKKIKGSIIITSTMADDRDADFRNMWNELPDTKSKQL